MNSHKAIKDTLDRVRHIGDPVCDGEPYGIEHLLGMEERITEDFSEGKVNRWLGYIQGVLVTRSFITLRECKDINKGNS